MEPIRIDLLTADPLSAVGVTSFLRSRPGPVLVAAADRGRADLRVVCCAGLTADVVATLRRLAPTGRPVILITDVITSEDVPAAVECRIVAVLSRAAVSAERLAEVVRVVARAGDSRPPNLVGDLLIQIQRVRHDAGAGPGLSRIERDVLRLTADGNSLVEIAELIRTPTSTVKAVSQRVVDRLQVRNRSHAVAYAVRTGLV
ncbi:LuxR C-terminal-related transcriptional regulator [Actinoplanes sp. NPDC049265]|uniref:helix-turn-helix transcriptional regulator n=1 Tax=Actinoplanes sp. NPDC049265 TaxID=3363902 RepID=UPI00372217D9